jgi:serpin B
MKLVFSTLGCVLLLGGGCGQNSSESADDALRIAQAQKRYFERAARTAFVDDNTAFALDLYHQLRGETGNLFFSPYSISTALAMTYAGARGETEKQMARALHFTLPQEKLHPAFAELQASLNAAQRSNTLQLFVANSLWPAKGLSLKRDFLDRMEQNYKTHLTPLDYGQTEVARETINHWVESQTRDKIKELFKPGILDAATVLVLANAIYFKGDWANPFKPENTRALPFQLTSANKINAPMMHQMLQCGYHADAEVQLLELPYRGDRLSIVVLLPRKPEGLAEMEQGLTALKLKDWLGNLERNTKVDVWLPKFKTTASFLLNDKLKALGMVAAFGAADFTGIFKDRGPYISAVVHKAFVEVNEQGTEAAAATGVAVEVSAPVPFRADHPFLFLIRDQITSSVLFLGRIVNPKPPDPP